MACAHSCDANENISYSNSRISLDVCYIFVVVVVAVHFMCNFIPWPNIECVAKRYKIFSQIHAAITTDSFHSNKSTFIPISPANFKCNNKLHNDKQQQQEEKKKIHLKMQSQSVVLWIH